MLTGSVPGTLDTTTKEEVDDAGQAEEVGSTGTLIPVQPTSQPSNLSPPLLKYYALRVTLPHTDIGQLQEVLNHYSKNYVLALHNADTEVGHEHFHIAMVDIDSVKQVEALRKQLKAKFKRAGNAFLAGKFMDNHVYKALQYMKHDDAVTFRFRGPHWQEYIDQSPEWDPDLKKAPPPQNKRKEGDPVFSFSNILTRSLKHRQDNQIGSLDLGVTLEHMTRTTNWIPSIQMMRNGLDPLHFKLFEYRASGRSGPTPNWWTPHSC